MRVTSLGLCAWLALSWLASCHTLSANENQQGNRYAILIGVENYRVESSGYHPLKYAKADVERLSKALLEAGYAQSNIRLMVDSSGSMAPNKANIYRQLKSITTDLNVTAEDSLLVVFAGHGFSDGGRSYLAPADMSGAARTTSAIPVSGIAAFLAESKFGEKYVIIDACRDERTINPEQKFDLLPEIKAMRLQEGDKQGIVFLSACLGGQSSIEDTELGQGVFMHFVCNAIEGEADFRINGNRDNRVSLFELVEYAANCTYDFVLRKYDVKQRPWADIHSTGDLTIASIHEERRKQLEAIHGAVVLQTADERQQILIREQYQRHAEDLMSEALMFLLDGNRKQTLEQVSAAIEHYNDYYLARRLRSLLYLLEGNKVENKAMAHNYYQNAIADMKSVGAKLRLRVPNTQSSSILIKAGTRTILEAKPGDVLQVDDLMQHNNKYWLRVRALQRKKEDGSTAIDVERPDTNGNIAFVALSTFANEEANKAQVDLFFTSQRAAGGQSTDNGLTRTSDRRLGSSMAQNLARGNTPRLDQIEAGIETYNRVSGVVNSVSNANLPTIPNPRAYIRSQTVGRIPGGIGGFLSF